MKKIFLSFLLVMAGISHTLAQGLDGNVEQRLKDFFTRYETSYANIGKCKLDRYEVNHDKKRLNVYASPSFGYQPFTPEKTEAIYRLLRQSLPGPVNYYDITIYADGKSIEDTENIIKRTRDVGNGNVPACSVPQKTCSPNHSSYLILYPCWKMREP